MTHPVPAGPDRIERPDVPVMERATVDALPQIQQLWPEFETLVGLRGRRMFARVDEAAQTYTVCTPIKDGDDPGALGLEVGVLAGGAYLRTRIAGEPEELFERVGAEMTQLVAAAGDARDHSRPLIEHYARRNALQLWVPVRP